MVQLSGDLPLDDGRTIYFHDVTGCFGAPLQAALHELVEQLGAYYPAIQRIAVEPLNEQDANGIFDCVASLLPGRVDQQAIAPEVLAKRRLFLLCAEDHPFVATARIENPRAFWGIAIPCQFAVAWVNNKYLWWHEALHLFNAKDCYNMFGIHKCQEPRCVMQASPTRETCGGRLHLCSKNIRRLTDELRTSH